jgi:hypothetical protein
LTAVQLDDRLDKKQAQSGADNTGSITAAVVALK